MPRLPAAGSPGISYLLPCAFLVFLKKSVFLLHAQMKTNFEIPIFLVTETLCSQQSLLQCSLC